MNKFKNPVNEKSSPPVRSKSTSSITSHKQERSFPERSFPERSFPDRSPSLKSPSPKPTFTQSKSHVSPSKKKKLLSPGDDGNTTLLSGDRISKGSRTVACIGTLEELSSYLGIIKSRYFDTRSNTTTLTFSSSSKLFLFAYITKIQEWLLEGKEVLEGGKHMFEYSLKIRELENEMKNMNVSGVKKVIIGGTSPLEAELLFARSICRRAERLNVVNGKGLKHEGIGIFLNRLGDYFTALSIYNLSLECKEPMIKK
jgi:cob(I)alamin adenosyltransferase